MKINVGTILSVKHYANDFPLKGKVLSCSDTSLSIHILSKEKFNPFTKDDPLALSFLSGNKVYVVSGLVTKFDATKQDISTSIEKIDLLEEKRLFERFPLSKNCTIKIGQSLTDYPGVIRNISSNGIMLLCNAEFPIYQKINVTFDIGRPITLTCIVIRKGKVSPTQSEYGLKIHYVDEVTPKIIKSFLVKLKKGY
jgi:hypothetical protein